MNQAESWESLLQKVEENNFKPDKATFCELHAFAGKEETLKWGEFRDSKVSIAGTEYQPPNAEKLDMIYNKGIEYILSIENPIECGMAFFLFGAINQFFYDVNKRTSRLIMNGILLSAGYDTINIPAKRQLEFNQKMINFYDTQDGSEMMRFLTSCSLDEKLNELFLLNNFRS